MSLPALPPLAALFLTHFDDTQGQSVIYYSSLPDIPAGSIEHTTLPSGLHTLQEDLVLFRHGELHGAGLFRSRERHESDLGGRGRGRRMGVVGVVLADGDASDLFTLRPLLSELYDQLESLSASPFIAPTTEPTPGKALLDAVWRRDRAQATRRAGRGQEIDRVHELVTQRGTVPAGHPVSYMPCLLDLLGPNIIPVYKAAVSGHRILLYSPPPLLPLTALAWNIWASSLAPKGALDKGEAQSSSWLGNVGLMDMDAVRGRTGGWIATTSDVIYKSHPRVYDIFIDLSLTPLSALPEICPDTPPSPSPTLTSSSTSPPSPLTYTLPALPLYRSLLLLTTSPPSVHAGFNKEGGWWLVVYGMLEKVWQICVGVCEFAVGRGNVGGGGVRLEDGEEDARLLDNPREEDLLDILSDAGDDDTSQNVIVEEESVRRGRLILRQLFHNTHHSYTHLTSVLSSRPRGEQSIGQLTDLEVRQLIGMWAGRQEAGFWRGVARRWGLIVDLDED